MGKAQKTFWPPLVSFCRYRLVCVVQWRSQALKSGWAQGFASVHSGVQGQRPGGDLVCSCQMLFYARLSLSPSSISPTPKKLPICANPMTQHGRSSLDMMGQRWNLVSHTNPRPDQTPGRSDPWPGLTRTDPVFWTCTVYRLIGLIWPIMAYSPVGVDHTYYLFNLRRDVLHGAAHCRDVTDLVTRHSA